MCICMYDSVSLQMKTLTCACSVPPLRSSAVSLITSAESGSNGFNDLFPLLLCVIFHVGFKAFDFLLKRKGMQGEIFQALKLRK